MQAPPDHPREEERQAALDDLELLDTPGDPYMTSLARVAHGLFQVDRVLITLVDRDRQWFKARAGEEVPDETPRRISFCGHAILSATETFVVPDAAADPRFADNPLVTGEPYIRFYAGHPLIAPSGLPVGTLCLLHSTPRELADDDRTRLRDLAQLVEGYIRLRSLSEHTRRLRDAVARERRKALIDPLTQQWNRAALEVFYPGEQAVAAREGDLLGALYIDLDHFKAVNDTHGHAVGDTVLVEAALRIAASIRPQDLLLRYGGEEFVVVARVREARALFDIGERIRHALAQAPILTLRGRLPVSASIGAATGAPGAEAGGLLKRADEALYAAKRGGRNAVVMAD